MELIINNWSVIITIFTSVITIASVINRYTRNETASKILYFLLRIVEIISVPGKGKVRRK
jgi:hypothetical protein